MYKALLFFILLTPVKCFAQLDSTIATTVISKFGDYSKKHVNEKVYLQLDQPYYAAGDTLFFKAYLTLGYAHLLSALSGVLHVDFIDNSTNKIIQSEKLEVDNGVAWGDLALPDTLSAGNYRIRAYTNLMRNESNNGFFEQTILIVPVVADKAIKRIVTSTQKPDIQFFPEGGSILSGVHSKIAFKAIGPNGLGIDVQGEIIDKANAKICNFSSAHLGMGYFYLDPLPGEIYRAALTYPGGLKDTVALPAASNANACLSVNVDTGLVAEINITADKACYIANKGRDYTLAIYSNGSLVTLTCRLDSMVIPLYLHKKTLHSGITRLTLFSPERLPISERLLFIQNNDGLKLAVSSDKSAYNKKENISIKLNALNNKEEPVAGDFSVSVTDLGKVPVDTNAESTILTNLLLTSELKGHVEQPAYYFNNKSSEATADLDLLMLTQGYRGFEWKQVLNDTSTEITCQPEKLLSIRGTIQTLAGKPVPNAEIGLASIIQLLAKDTTADVNGHFSFNNLDISDTTTLFLKAGKGNKSWKAIINPENGPSVNPANIIYAATGNEIIKPEVITQMKKNYWQQGNMKTGIMLKQVNIKENKNPEHLTPLLHSANLNGAGRADQVVMGDDLVGCAEIADCLASKLHGIIISYGGFPARAIITSIRSGVSLTSGGRPAMGVLLNGIISDQSILDEISPQDVYSIEVLQDPKYLAVYGSKATGGLLVITTRNGSERNSINIQPGLTKVKFNGFYKARTFYSPKYEVKTPEYSLPDNRSTIYWQPVLLTDKYGAASFDFYNADGNNTTYRVVIEGMDAKGDIGRSVYYYTVR